MSGLFLLDVYGYGTLKLFMTSPPICTKLVGDCFATGEAVILPNFGSPVRIFKV